MHYNFEAEWESLGIAFIKEGSRDVNPEQALINFVTNCCPVKNKQEYARVLGWLSLFSKYVFVGRLKKMCPNLNAEDLSRLGAISEYQVQNGDFRFSMICDYVKKRNGSNISFECIEKENFLKLKGEDEVFKEYGITVAKMRIESKEKYIPLEYIIQKNNWIKNRLRYGVNLRADVCTELTLDPNRSSYSIAKKLGFSPHSTKKIFDDFQLLETLDWGTSTRLL